MSPLSLHRQDAPACVVLIQRSAPSPLAAKAASCRRTPNTLGESTRPMDCAGRAERRRRFRTHHDPGKLPRLSRAPKRCRASLAAALKTRSGEPTGPVDCGDMSPLSLRRKGRPDACSLSRARRIPNVQPKRRRAAALQNVAHTPLWTAVTCHRFRCAARDGLTRVPYPRLGAFRTCSQSGVVPPHSKHARANPRPMDCAGRAERRRRFRAHHDPGKLQRSPRARG
jgi:hypothetical protein